MEISERDVRHIARLARLKLSEEEVRRYQDQLARILEHMGELGKIDTSATPPTAHVLGLTNVLREDEARLWPDRKALLDNAPSSEGPYYKVPKVIE